MVHAYLLSSELANGGQFDEYNLLDDWQIAGYTEH